MSANFDQKYRLIFENAPIGIVHFNESGVLTDCNSQFAKILGSVKEKLLGINMTTLPDKRVSDAVDEALSGNDGRYEGHYESITSGKITPVRVQFTGLYEDETIVGGIGIVEDISERISLQQMLTKFRLGIDHSSNPIYITDTDGYIQYVNPAFERHYGYKSKEAVGKTPKILKSGAQGEEFYQQFWSKIKSGQSAEGDLVNRTKEGELINVHYSTNPIIDETGEHLGYIAIQDNISERVEMEEQIRDSLREKNVMLAEIHHRVKNNLAIMSSLLELETFECDDKQTIDFIRKSQTRIKSMAIVHEKLYKNANLSKVNLKEYVAELVPTIRQTWIEDALSISFQMDIDDTDININQAIPLSLIIHELVTNSIKHAFDSVSKGTIYLKIKEDHNCIHCTFSDSGIDLPGDFDIDSSQKLGLSLVQLLTRQLNGSFSYDTENGLTYYISFEKTEKKGSSWNFSTG